MLLRIWCEVVMTERDKIVHPRANEIILGISVIEGVSEIIWGQAKGFDDVGNLSIGKYSGFSSISQTPYIPFKKLMKVFSKMLKFSNFINQNNSRNSIIYFHHAIAGRHERDRRDTG